MVLETVSQALGRTAIVLGLAIDNGLFIIAFCRHGFSG